jgi:thiamine transporter ThiT
MNDAAHEYHPGDMGIDEQVSTFDAFGKMIKWGSLTIAAGLVMLVLWFCLNAGFFGGLIPGIILLAVGIFFLREKPQTAH